MACLSENRNTARRPVLSAEIESILADAVASSLSAGLAAAALVRLPRLRGVLYEQVITACIALLREEAKRHDEVVAGLENDYERDMDDLKDKCAEMLAASTGRATMEQVP